MKPSPKQRHFNRARAASTKRQQARKRRALEQDNKYVPTCVASLVTAMWCTNHDRPWPARNRTCDGAS